MKTRGIRIDNGEFVYGCLVDNMWTYSEFSNVSEGTRVCEIITGEYESDNWEEAIIEASNVVTVFPSSVSIYFGKKDKNGKDIYTNDKVKYKSKEYEVKYFEEYGAFGLYDESKDRPLGRSGSSTKYEPYFMTNYHTKQMEIV